MVDYVKLSATVLRLITKNGKTINVKKLEKTAEDADKPWRGPADGRAPYAAEVDVMAVEVGHSASELSSYGAIISKDDIPECVTSIFICAAPAEDLTDFDEVLCEGTMYKIEMLTRLRPATTTLLWVIGVSR